MTLLSVTAADIDSVGTSIERELPKAWLDAELADASAAAAGPGRVTARLSRSGAEDIIVLGKVAATLSLPCARCLDPAAVSVEAELSLLLTKAPEPPRAESKARASREQSGPLHAPGRSNGAAASEAKASKRAPKEVEYEFTPEEAEHDTYDGEVVVLDPFVREAILLELPNFPLCSEACPGIRPGPDDGAASSSAPVDPRLSALAALRDRLPKGPPVDAPSNERDRPTKKKNKKE